MTDKDLARLWSRYVKELAVLLIAAEGAHPPQEVLLRMEALVRRELLLLYIRCCCTLLSSSKGTHLHPRALSTVLSIVEALAL